MSIHETPVIPPEEINNVSEFNTKLFIDSGNTVGIRYANAIIPVKSVITIAKLIIFFIIVCFGFIKEQSTHTFLLESSVSLRPLPSP